jgi:hypothetical protein
MIVTLATSQNPLKNPSRVIMVTLTAIDWPGKTISLNVIFIVYHLGQGKSLTPIFLFYFHYALNMILMHDMASCEHVHVVLFVFFFFSGQICVVGIMTTIHNDT